ncbi:hypothetical protein [Sphingomonas japonica]|uniref:Uncharacterized protein n=1 Tax=Sphingomonas japonica TaxID=511662 RepID=A0ABX0U3U7_9SPHN|nr:hypothetical protein [Sphingomonas japonica]NIJ24715.1 hypothetical protein [Sphingomonas japonica]
MLAAGLAILLGLGGGYALFAAWRRRGGWGLVALGWALLLAATLASVAAAGPEFGIAYALLGLSAIGTVFVGWGMETRPARRAPVERDRLPGDGADWRGALARFLLAVPLAGIAAALASVMVTGWLPGENADRHALAILGMPVVWGAAAWWVLADARPWRAASVLTGTAAVAALAVLA